MTSQHTSSQPSIPGLKSGSLGAPAIVFFVVAAAAPLAATLGAGPVVFAFSGVGGPAMYLIAAVVLLLFAIGFATMSRHVTSAGGFVAFAAHGLGRVAGYVMAGVALLAYAAMLIGLFGQFAVFTEEALLAFFGVAVPWQLIAIVGVILIGVLGFLDIQLSAAVLGLFMILEVLILVLFDVVVIATGGAAGINFDAFAWQNVFTPSMGAGLLFAFACFVGFEATVIYGEEARNPRRTVPRATYAAVILIGALYTVTMWALGLAYGSDEVQAAAAENPVEFFFAVNTAFVGEWSTVVMRVLVVTSLFAVLLAFHNTLSRYLFSLGRARFLPVGISRTHLRFRSPHVASILLSVITLVVLVAFMVAGADPFFTIYLWLVGVGTLGVVVLQAAGAAAVVGYFLRNRETGGGVWRRLVAPSLGFLGLAAATALGIVNFPLLTGVTEGPATWLPALLLAAAIVGVVIGVVRSRAHSIDLTFSPDDADSLNDERASVG